MRRALQNGFTLIELLIASSLLMLVLYSGYFGYAQFTERWEKRVDFYWQQTNDNLGLATLVRVIESAAPYVVELENNKNALFFTGKEGTITFISDSPLFSEGSAVVNVDVVQRGELHSVIYRETSLTSLLLTSTQQEIPWEYEVILSEQLNNLRFNFFGWESLTQAIAANFQDSNNAAATWYDEHNIKRRQILPNKIRLSFYDDKLAINELTIDLPENSYQALIIYLREDG